MASWSWHSKLLRPAGARQGSSGTALVASSPLQSILGALGLDSDEEEEGEGEDVEEGGNEEEGVEEEVFFSVPTLSAFLFLLRRKFPLSNIFSQFGSRVQ